VGSTLQLSLHSAKDLPSATDRSRLTSQLVQLLTVPSQVLQLEIHLLQCVGFTSGLGIARPG
jgi:hypothetical protein